LPVRHSTPVKCSTTSWLARTAGPEPSTRVRTCSVEGGAERGTVTFGARPAPASATAGRVASGGGWVLPWAREFLE